MESVDSGLKRGIYWDLIVTVGFFSIPSIISSVAVYSLASKTPSSPTSSNIRFLVSALTQLFFIILLLRILNSRGETIRSLSKDPKWSDLPLGLCLSIVAEILRFLAFSVQAWISNSPAASLPPQNIDHFKIQISALYVISIIVNPVCEEMVMRGFFQDRLVKLGYHASLIVVFSAALQAAYHVHQGIIRCVNLFAMFLVFAIFYHWTRRLWAVVIAHFALGLQAMLYNGS